LSPYPRVVSERVSLPADPINHERILEADRRYAVGQSPQGARRDLLDRVPAAAEVLDVGCWAGYMGRHLRRQRGANVDGIEPDQDMATLAGREYRAVYAQRIEDALSDLLPKRSGTYDVLLLLDVLEHLTDPWAVLAACRGFLRPGGMALVSIPNVAHWSVRKSLLLGRWRYDEHGLLDRTHLRFFTRRSARQLVTQAGWEVHHESASLGQPPLLRIPNRRLALLERWSELFAVQFLFEIRPSTVGSRNLP
jgi:2-polyprenyl-3-methyl-5-hydroxy-6-metoxy-1,4-benzoquinol methylase